jgi:hypothetical protein
MFRPTVVRVVLVSLVLLAIESPVRAQSSEPFDKRASVTVGASFGDGETALASSVALGFQLLPRLGLEFELAHARKLDFTLDLCPAPLVCVRGGHLPVTGRTVSLVPHLVVELLPSSHRLRVYVQAGGGVGHVRQRYFTSVPTSGAIEPVELTRSNMVAAFSFGGGAMVQLSRRLEVGADVRSLYVLDDESTTDRHITPAGVLSTLRVGSRVSWRF